uniref:Uncharacterized protein n=1 Tax=Brassica campestris TaxID=3711 RepID=A0A3P5ZKH9_BRACM|nr:unnamed protein product [Brassica rapa]
MDNTWDDLKKIFFKPNSGTSLKYSRKKKKYLTSHIATSSGGSTPPEPLEPKKLGKQNNVLVEIWLREETVRSTQKLHELVDWWVQTTPVAERKSGMVGRSAAGFLMNLHYSGSYFTSLNNSAGHLSSSNH